jgi:hypothetical protein
VTFYSFAKITARVTVLFLPKRRTWAWRSENIFSRVATEARKVRNYTALAQRSFQLEKKKKAVLAQQIEEQFKIKLEAYAPPRWLGTLSLRRRRRNFSKGGSRHVLEVRSAVKPMLVICVPTSSPARPSLMSFFAAPRQSLVP